jgi:hypothetical protein
MLTILSTELGQCNLSVDQFLQIFGDLINELRTKVGRKDEAESASSIIEVNFIVKIIYTVFRISPKQLPLKSQQAAV